MDVPLWKAAALGLLQGATEFLPISSSGHLVLGQHLLGLDLPGLSFEVIVHVGTLAAVIAAYRRDVVAVLRGVLEVLRQPWAVLGDPLLRRRAVTLGPDGRLAWLLLLGSIPAGLVGVLGRAWVEVAFSDLRAVGAGWLVSAGLLLLADRSLRAGRRGSPTRGGSGADPAGGRSGADPSGGQAVWVGLLQAAAVWPGISRSGSTIAAGLLAGLPAEAAARFSFLLSIPAIGGAALLDALDTLQAGLALPPAPLLVGFASAAASGYLAIHWLLELLRRGRLSYFAVYCLLLGLAVMLTQR